MSNFLKKQNKQIVIIVMLAIITIITAIPGLSVAASAPVIMREVIEGTNGRTAGEVKPGTKIQFTVTAENGLENVFFQWNRQIAGKNIPYTITEADYQINSHLKYITAASGFKAVEVSGKPKNYTLELIVPSSAKGLLELSVAANDGINKIKWTDIPYYVVNEYSNVNDEVRTTSYRLHR